MDSIENVQGVEDEGVKVADQDGVLSVEFHSKPTKLHPKSVDRFHPTGRMDDGCYTHHPMGFR